MKVKYSLSHTHTHCARRKRTEISKPFPCILNSCIHSLAWKLLADNILPFLEGNGVQRDFYRTETKIQQYSDFYKQNSGNKFKNAIRIITIGLKASSFKHLCLQRLACMSERKKDFI